MGISYDLNQEKIDAWEGKWRTKLFIESEFPAIPLFAIGSENWILEAPCNPTQQEKECNTNTRRLLNNLCRIMLHSVCKKQMFPPPTRLIRTTNGHA